MGIRFRFCQPTGLTLGYSVERLVDHARFDFADATFKADPVKPVAPVSEESGIFTGRYSAAFEPTPGATWWDGDYVVTVHDLDPRGTSAALEFAVRMRRGDGEAAFPPFASY